jgi:tRNA threonylcarbamoyladenosine biosynthesis protein TsaE
MDIIFTLDEIDAAAKTFLANTAPYKVIALHGEMGAGKTTFVHAICNALGVEDNIGSPTFSIINQYQTSSSEIIYHIDLYRLKNEEEAVQTGVEDCLYSGNYCLVEWPDRAPAIFPDNTLHVSIIAVNNDTRKLIINL